jgi:hypothetical protein
VTSFAPPVKITYISFAKEKEARECSVFSWQQENTKDPRKSRARLTQATYSTVSTQYPHFELLGWHKYITMQTTQLTRVPGNIIHFHTLQVSRILS